MHDITRRAALGLSAMGFAGSVGLLPLPALAQTGGERPTGWTDLSHGEDVDPDYDVVFPADRVQTLTIVVDKSDWQEMQSDLDEIFRRWLPVREGVLAAGADITPDARQAIMRDLLHQVEKRAAKAKAFGDTPPEPENGGRQPIWVPATIRFEGKDWTHVGLRYKGVSSLSSAWMMGDPKLPLKLDFDQFEDEYPETKNQRFFGFKQLSLANNTRDPAGLRDILAYDILRAAGLPSLRAVPCEVMLDQGNGPVRLGLYTLIEVVDDTGVQAHFGSADGNIYEGYGRGASFAIGTDGQMEEHLEKKNNTKMAEYGDVRALYDILHEPNRTTDPALWRADLQSVFNVDAFLEWLGIATFIGHADTYGTLEAVNFFLYNDLATGQLTWISWDHNDAFNETLRPFLSYEKAGKADDFPLSGFLLQDPVFRARYIALLEENSKYVLAADALTRRIRGHAAVIATAAVRDQSRGDYEAAVAELDLYVQRSEADLQAFLQAHR